jgi:class 3 adenylate cyclase/tetratricopeptide (TPR) repeat protein
LIWKARTLERGQMQCTRCNATSPANSRYCDACGAPLQPACPSCGHANRLNARFCGGCGRALMREEGLASAEVPAPALPGPLATLLSSRFAREGERKEVTVLFADIRGSTELIQELDPEQAMQRLEPVLQAMAKAVHHFGGTVSRMHGDGIMALFGAPLAFEDHAVRACFAARAMIEAVARLREDEVAIRVGLSSGEVVVHSIGHDLSMEYDAVGLTTHLANRMEQLATPGTACMTARTARLAGGFIEVRPRGLVEVKGMTRPVEVFELVGTADQTRWQVRATAHSLTYFVGRETELRVLADALRHTRQGRGQIVAVAGEAGMGKSRLVHEFLRGPQIEDLVPVSGAAMPHDRNTPYQLIAQILRNWLRVESHDSQARIDEKLVAAIAALDERLGRVLPPLRSLLDLPLQDAGWEGLDPALRRQQTLDAVRSLVLQSAASAPFILVVEDMHWADFESQALLDAVVASLGTAHLLVIVTYRPEYQNRWARHSYYSLVQLGPLENTAADGLLKGLLGDADDLQSLRSRMIEQTDGTPLFLEEMARTLVETGVLVSEPTRFRLTQSVDEVEIPDSVQSVLASRIDRLPSEERTLLQIASVIGKDVPVALLRAVAGLPDARLARQLIELQTQEFMHEVTGSSGAEYTFKHALTHSVAYDSMLMRHRRTLHAHVMAAIEDKFADRLDEFTERLADHALRGEVWDKAALYAQKAGQRANQRSAHRAATVFFRHALDAVSRLPSEPQVLNRAIDIRLGLRVALAATGDLGQVRRYLQEAEALARSVGDERRLMPIVISRSTILINLGDLADALEAGQEGRAFAERFADEACLVSSAFALAQAWWNRGDFAKAEEILSDTVRNQPFDRRKRHGGTTGTATLMCLVSLSHTHSLAGQCEQALMRGREALEMATEIERPYDLSYAHAALGLAHLTIGELDGAIVHLEEASRISRAYEILLLVPHAARYLGRAYALAGRLDEAEKILVEAVQQTRSQSLAALCGWCSAELGFTRGLSGAHRAAESPVRDALDFARRQGYRPLEAHAMRLMGLLGARAGDHDAPAGERWLTEAAALAHEIGMRPELAHCHHDLGELFADGGRPAEARAELAAALELYVSMGMVRHVTSVKAALAALAAAAPAGPAHVADQRTSGLDSGLRQ